MALRLLGGARASGYGTASVLAAAAATAPLRRTYASNARKLFGVAFVERIPVIMKEQPEWVTARDEVMARVDAIRTREYPEWYHSASYAEDPNIGASKTKKKKDSDGDNDDDEGGPTGDSFWERFEAAPRTTAADAEGDTKSLDRALDSHLYLVVRDRRLDDASLTGHPKKRRDKNRLWRFPTAEVAEGENMRATAERAVTDDLGEGMDLYFFSNAPNVHHEEAGASGADHAYFCYRVHHIEGTGEPSALGDNLLDYAWLTKSELKKSIDRPFFNAVKHALDE